MPKVNIRYLLQVLCLNCAGWTFVNLTLVRVIWEERTSTKKMSPTDWPMGKCVENFLDY